MADPNGNPIKPLPVSSTVEAVTNPRCLDLAGKIVYHYCSAETLLSIPKKKTIRFTDASCLNDGEEVIWAENQINTMIQRIRDRENIDDDVPAISKAFMDQFVVEWDRAKVYCRHFLSCFSLEGDSLSQWRAYAGDAQGFAVGFQVDDIDVPAFFTRVVYDVKDQQDEITRMLSAMYLLSRKDKAYFDNQGKTDVFHLFSESCAYKNPAFMDEKEVRAVHMVLSHTRAPGRAALRFVGGTVGGEKIEKGDIEYRVTRNKLVPSIDLEFQLHSECAIKEIWLGPRCNTTNEEFCTFLETVGYNEVAVHRAGSRYR